MPDKITKAQEAAITKTGKSLLVGAAAGSGKTMVLSERVVHLLMDEENPVKGDEFAAMTFTVAAAGELRSRIENKIAGYIEEHPEDKQAEEQLMRLKRAPIGTIHSFCASILREFAHEADIAPDFSIGDELDINDLSAEALSETVDRMYEEPDSGYPDLVRLFGRSRDDSTAEDALLCLASFLETMLRPEDWIRKVREEEFDGGKLLLDHLIRRIGISEKLLLQAEKDCQENGFDKLSAILASDLDLIGQLRSEAEKRNYTGCRELIRPKAFKDWNARGLSDDQKQTAAYSKELRDKAKEIVTEWVNSNLTSDETELETDRAENLKIFNTMIRAWEEYRRIFSEKKAAAKVLSFDDLERKTLELLRNEVIREEIENRYDAFFVDEFQDVSPVQAEIISLITKRRRTLFGVGDVKQSIYGFRKADPTIFTSLAKTGKDPECPDLEYLTLTDNFRSCKAALNSVNTVFDAFMTPALGDVVYEDERLTYTEDANEGEGPGLDFRLVGGSLEDEAKLVASIITKKRAEGYDYGDFCIMYRAAKNREAYERALDSAGIPHSAPDRAEFFETSEVSVILSLLRLIRNSSLDLDAAAVMLSPLFGFQPDDLLRLKRSAKHRTLVAAAAVSGEPKLQAFAEKLAELRKESFRKTLKEFMETLYDETSAELLLTAGANMTDRRQNLRILLSLACERSAAGDDLRRFLRLCDRAAESGNYKGNRKTSAAKNAVTLTTVHGSKGLQWTYVILVDSEHRFQTEEKERVLFDEKSGFGAKVRRDNEEGYPVLHSSAAYKAVARRMEEKDRSEEMRILYVALTRAKNRTYVLGRTGNSKPENLIKKAKMAAEFRELGLLSGSHMEWVLAACQTPEGRKYNSYCTYVPEEELEESADETAVKEADPVLARRLAERCKYVYPYARLKDVPAKAAVTAIAEGENKPELRLPDFTRKGRPSGAEVGTAMHAFMQFADYQRAAVDPQAEVARLLALGFFDERSASLVNTGKISAFFRSPLGQRILSSDIRRELEFMHPVDASLFGADTGDDQVIVQGIADCVIIDEDGIVIVDYKTDRIAKESDLAERYKDQLRIYGEALGPMLGKRVKQKVLYSFHLDKEIEV